MNRFDPIQKRTTDLSPFNRQGLKFPALSYNSRQLDLICESDEIFSTANMTDFLVFLYANYEIETKIPINKIDNRYNYTIKKYENSIEIDKIDDSILSFTTYQQKAQIQQIREGLRNETLSFLRVSVPADAVNETALKNAKLLVYSVTGNFETVVQEFPLASFMSPEQTLTNIIDIPLELPLNDYSLFIKMNKDDLSSLGHVLFNVTMFIK